MVRRRGKRRIGTTIEVPPKTKAVESGIRNTLPMSRKKRKLKRQKKLCNLGDVGVCCLDVKMTVKRMAGMVVSPSKLHLFIQILPEENGKRDSIRISQISENVNGIDGRYRSGRRRRRSALFGRVFVRLGLTLLGGVEIELINAI